MSVSVVSARKSILSIPMDSTSFMSNCVVMSSPLRESGTLSAIFFRQMTTPAACMEVLRGIPSSFSPMSMTRLSWSSDS